MREYPISTLLVWRTKDSIKHRKFIDNFRASQRLSEYFVPDNEHVKNLVLDGQQRSQSLFIGLRGSYEGRELYFDVLSGDPVAPDDIRFRFKFMAQPQWSWIKLKDLVHDLERERPNKVFSRLETKAMSPLDEAQRERLRDNLDLVWREFAHDENISYQELDGVDSDAYQVDDVVEISSAWA